jgi:hypothetical protein
MTRNNHSTKRSLAKGTYLGKRGIALATLLTAALVVLSSQRLLHAETGASDKPSAARQAVPRNGLTVLWGGGEPPPAVWERFVEAARAGKCAVVISETAERELAP